MAHLKNYTSQPEHKVFLSHSGAQKGFVEQLCVDLKRYDRFPVFDERQDSLPMGKDFPRLKFEAIEECKVGVVALSEEFFTSKWSMLELVAMAHVKKRKPNFTILPIFLGISPSQCHDVDNHERWSSLWHIWAKSDSRIDVEDWANALQLLGRINGLKYNFQLGEVKLREEIVECICKLIPPITWLEDSYVQGRSHLCKVIHERIEDSKLSSLYGMHVVGLYGIRGIGKTTLCKAMCKDEFQEFQGKVAYIELGSQSQEVLLNEVLRRLTGVNLKYFDAVNVDENYYRLTRDMINVKVFLAIDNVSRATSKQALTLLRAKYGLRSVVLVTARSLNELTSLGIDASECIEMPELELEEAKSLFLYHATCVPPSYSSDKDAHELISSCIQRCSFKKGDGIGYAYHPLALQILGKALDCVGYDPQQWWLRLHKFDFLNLFGEPPVFAMWRRSFDATISQDQQDQISISDGYPVSEVYFPYQLEDKTIEPEAEMLGMMSEFFMGTPLAPYCSTNGALKFSMADLNIITGNFSESLMVGQGGSGSVYRGQLEDGTLVAVKRMKKAIQASEQNDKNVLEIEAAKDFQIEADTLSEEKHLNLVRLLGFLEDENELILVTEYVTNGNLRQHLDGVPYGVILDMPKRCRISLDVVAALKHLHNQPKDDLDIIHRDIKSSDILITNDFHAKVAGFGLFQHSPFGDVGASSGSTQVKLTSAYTALEHLKAHHLKEQNDVYSFGALVVEIFTGKRLVESSLPSDECFTLRWVLKQCAEERLMDIIDPKLTPTTFDLRILEQIFKLATSCLVPEESSCPTMEGLLGAFSFILGLYSRDLMDESNSKGDKHEVQKKQERDHETCIEPNLQTLCFEESKALKGQLPTQHLEEVDSSNPSFMPIKPHLFVEDLEDNKVQTSTHLDTQFEVDSQQAIRQAFELLVAKQDQSSPLFTTIISDVFQLKSDETYFEMLQEEIAKLGYISRLLSQDDDFELNPTSIGKTSFFLYFNEKDDVFEFYFKNYQGMARIVGVGLECSKVVLEDGWRVTIQEIARSNWDDAWKNFDSSSSTMKVTIPEPLEEGMNMEDSQEPLASIPRGQCLLLDLAQYFILKMAISSFLRRASMTHANTDSGTSSNSSSQDIASSSSSSDQKPSGFFQAMKNIFISREASNQLKTRNGDGTPMDPPGDGDVKIDTTVHLKLLPGGRLIDGNDLMDAMSSDDTELKTLTSQLDNTIFLEMMFKFLNEDDRKEIQVIVGPISFQFLEENEVNFEKNKRFGWYHKLLDVSFGPVNASHSDIGPNHKALDIVDWKLIKTTGSSDATTHDTSKSLNGEVKGSIPHILTLSSGGSSGWGNSKSESVNIGDSFETPCQMTHGGFHIFPKRYKLDSKLKYVYRAPNFHFNIDHQTLANEDYRKLDLNHLPMCIPQDVKFEGTWHPKKLQVNPRALVEYTLIASRMVYMTSKDISKKDVKKSWAKKCGQPAIQKASNEPLKYTQENARRFFLNHAMTHLKGGKFKVEEFLSDRRLNQTEPETHLEDLSCYVRQWNENPLVELNSRLDYQP